MTEPPDDKPHPHQGFIFPPEFAACIGDVISCWAALDYNANMSIWHLAGVYPAIGACMTMQIFTLEGRLKALIALLRLRRAPDDLVRRVNKFRANVRKPQEIRNRITHDCWFKNPVNDRMSQLEIGTKGVLVYGFKPIDIDALKADRDEVRKAMREAANIRTTIEAGLPTLPEIPLGDLHPTVLYSQGHLQTRSSDNTFLLFPPKPSPESP